MPIAANRFASTNRVQLRYIQEVDFKVIPVTGNCTNLRMTGESLDYNLTKQTDKEIRSDRQQTSTTTVSASGGGDVKMHMQYDEYDPFFAALLQDAWSVYGTNGVGTSFTATFTATTITASAAPTGTSDFTTLKKGQWFRLVTGSGTNNGKLFRASTIVAPSTTVITLDAGTPAAVGAGIAGCIVQTSRLKNGTTMPSFALERSNNDIGQFISYFGSCVSKFSISFASGSLTEGSFTFVSSGSTRTTSTQLPGTPQASTGYDVQNAVRGVAQVWENGAPITGTSIKSMSLDVDNNLRGQEAIGTLGYAGIGVGTFTVKGQIEFYFADGTMYDKFTNDTYTSIILSTQDTAGNGYVFTLPRVNLTSGKVQAGAKDSDMMASFSYEAYGDVNNVDTSLQYTVFMDRVGVAVVP